MAVAPVLYITASVHTDSPELAARSAQTLSALLVGMALDGCEVHLTVGQLEDEEEPSGV